MSPDDLLIIQKMIDEGSAVDPWVVVAVIVSCSVAAWLGLYLKEKGKT